MYAVEQEDQSNTVNGIVASFSREIRGKDEFREKLAEFILKAGSAFSFQGELQ